MFGLYPRCSGHTSRGGEIFYSAKYPNYFLTKFNKKFKNSIPNWMLTMEFLSVWMFEREKLCLTCHGLFFHSVVLYSEQQIFMSSAFHRYVRSVSFQCFDGLYNDICPGWYHAKWTCEGYLTSVNVLFDAFGHVEKG